MDLRPGHKKDEGVEVNLTPLIDVVFLLLIFFMVSSTFDRHAKLKVQLPQAEAQMQQPQDNPVVLSIDANGKYYIDDRQVVNEQLETLKKALRQTVGERTDVTLLLRADGRTPHQSVVRAMDAASQLGLTKLSIATVENH
ncbi:MAG: biopolymer transporter ExbD [Gammaproteobacteria bacterium]|jgi:biopolymer transport protein ExbD|nr:biopolymer transporter ExbD [Gammaproteobacteria bacterium]